MHEDEYEHDHDAYAAAHIEWLKTVNPDDWHRAVLAFQWSEAFDPLLWIVQQENCDKATALKIFWAMAPEMDDAKSVRAGRSDGWTSDNEIAEYIANRLNGTGYQRAKIAFDAEPMMLGDYEHFQREMRGIDDPLWRPHPDMIKSIRGREVTLDQGFDHSVPEAFAPVMFESPPLKALFPYMETARSEIDTILFNWAGIGVALGIILFIDWSGSRGLMLAGVAVAGALWSANQISKSAAIVRSLFRADYVAPSKFAALVIGAAGIAVGALAAYVFLRLPLVETLMAASSAGLTAVRAVAAIALLAALWLVARLTSKQLMLRAYN